MKSPLLIPLASIRQGENRFSIVIEPDELALKRREVTENPSFEAIQGPVRVDLKVTRDGKRLLVTGSVSFRARLDCAFCTEEYETGLSEPLNAELIGDDTGTTTRHKLESEDVDRLRIQGDRLDLTSTVHDAIHLAVPIAPSCRPDCKGLCPDCGADLNLGSCACGH